MIDFDTARAQLLAAARSPVCSEMVALQDADGRVLAADVIAPLAVPGFDNSAMDGYALNVADLNVATHVLPVVARIAAGDAAQPLPVGCAARIFTGAPIPAGCNVVEMQENCHVEGDTLHVDKALRAGQHIRRMGEDIAKDAVVLPRGERLNPAALALLASMGIAEVCVYTPLKVALLNTGNELAEPGQPLQPGQIYNSNRYALTGLLRRLGCELTVAGLVTDDFAATRDQLAHLAESHDVVMTTGGVSVGEEDHVKAAVQALGELHVWKIAIKPGKPFAYGKIANADFIGLPGNPVSSFVTFLMLVRPFLLARSGVRAVMPQVLQLPAGFTWKKASDRREFLRAKLDDDGRLQLHPNQGSGVMTSLAWADGLVELPAGETVAENQRVRFLPLTGLV
ncbi:MAG TPA: gephyrin-like molybdotransferase Glp [Chromobacteriaceae bacterium]|nr:gephyrin-like molybdotransferase Glp [Chromobacteriaceae bacterium]